MNTKNNRRRRESVEKIETTFMKLIEEKDVNGITVSQICKLSGLNRSTFYANFVDIYDLADKLMLRLSGEVQPLIFGDSKFPFRSQNFFKLFEHIKENQELYNFYFKMGFDRQKMPELFRFSYEDYGLDESHSKYHIAFFKNGFNAVLIEWINGGCAESPEEMLEILLSEYRGRTIE